MSQHAAASPSSAGMWMNCPASVTLAEGLSRPSSKYAREGTAAHKIAEMIIGGDLFPPAKITVEGDEFIVSRDMLRHLNGYIDYVEKLAVLGDIYIETRVGLSLTNGLVWGTADCISVYAGLLQIVDLKYGKGVPVDPNSPQLKIYALAAMEHLNVFPTSIALVVFQPRLDPDPKLHLMSVEALRSWAEDELKPAVTALNKGSTKEVAGTWCRWCVRRDVCQAFAKKKSSIASESFDDGVDTT
jgi:hypothetical protein